MKKIIYILLCLALSVPFGVSASEDKSETEKLGVLQSYGIFQGDENGNLNLDSKITRAEFCKVILSALGYSKDELTKSINTADFSDVDNTHWAYLYIYGARQIDLINGDENGCFLPEDDITKTDVLKMAVTALGYKPMAEKEGGYPNGYVTVAQKTGLIKNTAALDEPALRKEVADIIYTALDVPIMQVTGFGEEVEYSIMDGTNGIPHITWQSLLKGEQTVPEEQPKSESEVPMFNGPEYTGRVLKITELNKTSDGYTFKNALDKEDSAAYVINGDTYVYMSVNTVGLEEIKEDMYAQCWYRTDDSENIEILKIELMKEKPSGI